MPSGDEEGSSAFGTLSRNWRSALVVNGLFDALEETERQRDELAQNLRWVMRGWTMALLWSCFCYVGGTSTRLMFCLCRV